MNNKLKIGLLLQIPNIILILFFGIIYLMGSISTGALNFHILVWIILGTIYGLIQIASIVFLVLGIFDNGK